MKSRFVFLLFLLSCLILSFGCGRQEPGQVEASPSNVNQNSSEDPRFRNAYAFIEKFPESPQGYTTLAALYIKRARETGDSTFNTKAETAVNKALEIAPKDIQARKFQASLELTFHRFSEGLALGEKLKQEFPDDPFVYAILTDANVELGNYEQAIEAAQKMVDLKPNSNAYARVAHLRSLHGDHAGAVQMLTTAARTADPQDKEAQSYCLMQLSKEYFKVGDLNKATKVIDESLQISPNYPLALIEKARYLAAAGDLDGAEAKLQQANTGVTLTEASIMLGDISGKRGNLEEARRQYAAAEDAERAGDGDIHRFALLWADQGERLDEALEVARADYETNKDIYASDILAWCLLKKGMAKEAQAVVKNALRLKTKDARILYHAGMIERELGNKKLAAKYLAEALRINPNFDLLQADQARLALDKLRNV